MKKFMINKMPEKKSQKEIWLEWIEACKSPRRALTDWEQARIEDWENQIEETGSLSVRQAEILEKIYSEKT
jgi:hypothetical protein